MVKVAFCMWMVIYLKGNGNEIEPMDLVFMCMQMVPDMKGNGRKIYSMALASRNVSNNFIDQGRTVHLMRDTTLTVRSKVRGNMCGVMAAFMMENGRTIKYQDRLIFD